MTEFQQKLFSLQDTEYQKFNSSLIPTVKGETLIGVKIPKIRKLAKEISKDKSLQEEVNQFLNKIPHVYFEENLLHAFLLCEIKNYQEFVSLTEKFLPYIDNWSVCDSFIPKILQTDKVATLELINKWVLSEEEYTVRFAIETLMRYYLDEDFKEEYLEIPLKTKLDTYYVKMMIAWFYATALSKQWNATVKILEENRMERWCHNKTIQKAKESYRITPEQKVYLQSLKKS